METGGGIQAWDFLRRVADYRAARRPAGRASPFRVQDGMTEAAIAPGAAPAARCRAVAAGAGIEQP